MAKPITRKKVAIVGGGSAGIAALYALNRTPHDVYIYEAGSQLGAHTDAVEFRKGKYRAAVDTGFILNTAIHPNFFAFLKTIGVETERTDMTTSISRDQGRFEWATSSFDTIFAQRQNLLNPRFWRLLLDILRFNQFALDLLKVEGYSDVLVKGSGFQTTSIDESETIGQYLTRAGYSKAFRNDYLIPSTVDIWTSNPDTGFDNFPMVTLVQCMWDNDLLSTFRHKSDWRTITQGAKSYIEAVMRGFPPNHILLNSAVEDIGNDETGKVVVTLENGTRATYDHVVIATNPDQAKALILPNASRQEREILSGFERKKHTAILHSDLDFMPKNKHTWASRNYITSSSHSSTSLNKVSLTYDMNALQHIPTQTFGHILVTLNPLHSPSPKLIQGQYKYSQTLHNPATIRAQARLPQIQNKRGISYCGAWTELGVREDDFSSGLKIAQQHLGAKLPFKFHDSSVDRKKPSLGLIDLFVRLVLSLLQFFVLLVERLWIAQGDFREEVQGRLQSRLPSKAQTHVRTNGWHKRK